MFVPHLKLGRTVGDKGVNFMEAARVKQGGDPFPGSQLTIFYAGGQFGFALRLEGLH